MPSGTAITAVRPSGRPSTRPRVDGKFFFCAAEKVYLRGVTYGPLGPEGPYECGDPKKAASDFSLMAQRGINTVRTYTLPPQWLLDLAQEYNLWVLAGLPWAQHVAFLEGRRTTQAICRQLRRCVRSAASHPAVFGYAIGNEIPASIVRWHGPKHIEKFLRRLYQEAKSEDPEALFTYVNYPTTEYLQLPFLDFISFNLYLESEDQLQSYLPRLQNLSGNLPFVMAELGLDSRRNGQERQAEVLAWQLRQVFRAGSAGAFVFSWTDQWHRGGRPVLDWDFGLIDRQSQAKPALEAVSRTFLKIPFSENGSWPRISAVVCVYNAEETIGQCLESLSKLDYPNYEAIVIDDGSKDGTGRILDRFRDAPRFRIIRTENRGLSHARNLGWQSASGEIVAYIDADAYPDPHWLNYLAIDFQRSDHAALGGPNIPPPGQGLVAQCVAHAPGGPVHVLLSDEIAEHVPGCNIAFRRSCLKAIGGFDPRFRTAGDDVDVCWRMQLHGWTIGFSPAAVVWHYCRGNIAAYWRQQRGYGRAETLLEQKWPEKYNDLGHVRWGGRIYNAPASPWGGRIYHGVWGSGFFQTIYQPAPGMLQSFPLTPEWYLVAVTLALLTSLAIFWKPLSLLLPILVIGTGVPLFLTLRSAVRTARRSPPYSGPRRWLFILLTWFLHLLQPLARLRGRLGRGWRLWPPGSPRWALPMVRSHSLWSSDWHPAEDYLREMEKGLRDEEVLVRRGGAFDRWDLEARIGGIGSARIRMAVEEHESGRQLIRFRSWPRWSAVGGSLVAMFAFLAALASFDRGWEAAAVLGLISGLTALRALLESAAACGAWKHVISSDERRVEE